MSIRRETARERGGGGLAFRYEPKAKNKKKAKKASFLRPLIDLSLHLKANQY